MGHAGSADHADPALPRLISLPPETKGPLPATEAAFVVAGVRDRFPAMSKVAIHLDARAEAFVDEMVRSGAYPSPSDVIIHALDEMRRSDVELAALKAKIQEGLDELEAGFGIEVEDVELWLEGLGR